MANLYDVDGNLVEGALSPDEVKSIQEKAEQTDKYAADIAARDEELSKLREKDFNFKKFRDATKEQQDAMTKNFSEERKANLQINEGLSREFEEFRNETIEERKRMILDELSGGDQDLRKQIEETAKVKFGEQLLSKKNMQEGFYDAYTLIKGARPSIKPINRYAPVKEYFSPTGPVGYTKTTEGDANFRKWFPQVAAIEDKVNKNK